MTLQLGETIRALRKRDGRTQEDLAAALGITAQAISRWEVNAAYPDMELIPAIANYFGITIDRLFGYENERDKRIEEMIGRVNSYNIKARGDDEWIEECLPIIREGLLEFPQNERLLITLADTLCEAGWRRCSEHVFYNDEGWLCHDTAVHRKNIFWTEAASVCESLLDKTKDAEIYAKAAHIAILIYRNFGEYEKAAVCAMRMPELSYSREVSLAYCYDGKEQSEHIGGALLKLASEFARQLVYGVMANLRNFDTDMPIEKIKGAISVFELLCEDGNFGEYNGQLIELHLYLSALLWSRGYRDEAFSALYKALYHAKDLETLLDGNEHSFTAALVKNVKCRQGDYQKIAETLPDDFPFWNTPDMSQTVKEMKADPRWAEWVAKTKE